MNKWIVLYYSALLLILCMWMSPDLPPMSLRLVFFGAVLVPMFRRRRPNYVVVLSLFVIISANRIFPSFMPSMPEYLLIATAMMLLGLRHKPAISPSPALLLMLLFPLTVNYIHSHQMQPVSFTILTVILFYGFVDYEIPISKRELAISFLIISAILCLEAFLYRGQITSTMTVGFEEYERVGWNDPNYFSSVLGMGALVALHIILSREYISTKQRNLLLGLVFLVLVVMLLVASRGGMAALAGGVIMLLLLSRKENKTAGKLLMVILFFLAVMYAAGAFDFLFSRVENDEGGLGGRTLTWGSKISEFTEQATLRDWLFGLGLDEALSLAGYLSKNGETMGFHNDYLAFLMSYGAVGLAVLFYFFIQPIVKYRDPAVTSGIVYLMLISFSLEPLSNGLLYIYYFYFYLTVLGTHNRIEKRLVNDFLLQLDSASCTT